MSLDTYTDPESLYTARGDEVNPNRPLFTGDIFRDVTVPGIPDSGMAMIVAHPCSFRGGSGQLADRVLVATVRSISKQGRNAWTRGLFDRMPLPDLDGVGSWAAYLADVGQAPVADLLATERLACLSEIGINLLQQRLTFHLTRAEIPTQQFDQAFSHILVEADLLEDWTDTLTGAGWTQSAAAEAFENFVRAGDPNPQGELLDPQRRAHVRTACKREAARIVASPTP